MVLVMARLARRLTGSTVLGLVAGLLLMLDGLHFVLSRLALLDIFLAFFLLCAVACLVADRDWYRARMARLQPGPVTDPASWGPVRGLLLRPVAAGQRGVLGPGGGHQVDRALPAGRLRTAGLAVERRRAPRRSACDGRCCARCWPTACRPSRTWSWSGSWSTSPRGPAGWSTPRSTSSSLSSTQYTQFTGEGRCEDDAYVAEDPDTGARWPTADRGRRRGARRGRPVAALAVVLPPGRLHLPHPLPGLLEPHLPVRPAGLAAAEPARRRGRRHRHRARHPRLRRARRAATACARCC